MKLLKSEAYKLFIKRYLIIVFIVCLIAEAGISFHAANKIKLDNADAQDKYESYMSMYSGEITEEKQAEIDKLLSDDEAMSSTKDELIEKYINREITDEEYEKQMKIYNEHMIGRGGFLQFIADFENTVGSDKYLMDQKPWGVLFGNESIDFILVFFIILSATLLSVYDEESGANSITFPATNGKGKKWFSQLVILVLTVAFVSVCISLIKYESVNIAYGLNNSDFAIHNIEVFFHSTKNLTLLQGYIVISIIKALGAVYTCVLAFAIGSILKQSLLTVFTSFSLIFLPNYIFPDREYKYLLPLPSAFLTANGYLFGDNINDIIYFKSLTNNQIAAVAVLSVIIVALLIVTSYFKIARRKSL